MQLTLQTVDKSLQVLLDNGPFRIRVKALLKSIKVTGYYIFLFLGVVGGLLPKFPVCCRMQKGRQLRGAMPCSIASRDVC